MIYVGASIYYPSYVQNSSTYNEAVTALHNWYNNSAQRARILTKSQLSRFAEEMSNDSDESKLEVFRKFVAKLMSLQKQLAQSHHDDRFLKDRLMTAADILSIQVDLTYRNHCTDQKLANKLQIDFLVFAKPQVLHWYTMPLLKRYECHTKRCKLSDRATWGQLEE